MTTPSRILLTESLRVGACSLECTRGHKTNICLQDAPFEIQFHLGMDTLLDGYFAESVFNIAKAIERFHEWCIKLFLARSASDELDKTWKMISNASERQFGGFVLLFHNHFQKSPPSLHNKKIINNMKWIEFRNKTTHPAYLPTSDEARTFTEISFEYIQKIIIELRKNDLDKIQGLTAKHLQALRETNMALAPSTLGGIASRFLAREDISETTFEKELNNLLLRKEAEQNRRPLSNK